MVFTPTQQAWITSHPDITYTVSDRWPQDYRENGQHVGLSRSVLNEISRRTGLHFVYVPQEQALLEPPMMIAAISSHLLPPEEKARWLFTESWANTMPMLVGKSDMPGIRSLNQMRGKRMAILQSTEYEPWLRSHYPDIHLIEYTDVRDALKSVEQGQVDAALGSGMVMFPIVQRFYAGELSVTAQIPEMASGVTMAVDLHYPQLRDILNQAIKSTNANDAQQIYDDWVGVVRLGTPPLSVIFYYYRYQFLIFGGLFLLLMLALYVAIASRRRALASEKSKSEFLAIMSHEIRTPMNAIIASLELLQQPVPDKKKQEYQALALSSSQDLLELLNNVLDHSKLNQQQVPLHLAPCDIRELLTAVCDSQRSSAARKGLTLELTFDASVVSDWLEADAHRLRQIVNNLVSNAVKFTDHGGVKVHVSWQDALESAGALTLSVQDSGIGIAKADQQRLFKAWQQAENKGRRLRSGSGLGLYLCRTLVKQMRGELTLRSVEGQGSTFVCVLPLNVCTEPHPVSELPSEIALPEGIAVLVVEDHPANQQVLAEQLSHLACFYEMADSAEAAMQLLHEENYYDAMLLDCNLPGKDGYWLAEQIRLFERENQRDRTPLIAISAVSSPEHHRRCLASGMDDVLVKPIRMVDLARKLMINDVAPMTEPMALASEEVRRWLQQDLVDFQQACLARDSKHMIHFIHRIRGVAQMNGLVQLAQQAEEIESSLRHHPEQSDEMLQFWQTQLKPHFSAEPQGN